MSERAARSARRKNRSSPVSRYIIANPYTAHAWPRVQ